MALTIMSPLFFPYKSTYQFQKKLLSPSPFVPHWPTDLFYCYIICKNYFLFYFSPVKYKLYNRRELSTFSPLYLQLLKECLSHNRFSIHICWINEFTSLRNHLSYENPHCFEISPLPLKKSELEHLSIVSSWIGKFSRLPPSPPYLERLTIAKM